MESKKVAHRDIKTQNILVYSKRVFKVADLGEAKNVSNPEQIATLKGSELYMSPILYQEYKYKKRNVLHNPFKSDVFLLGYSFLYAICLNLKVLEEIRELSSMNIIALAIRKYINKKLYSDNLVKIILKMIEIDETKRYQFHD